MHSKNNNKTQTYIQGLRPFSSAIPKTLKKYIRKGGYNYSNIVDNWTKMVSKDISNACYPISVKMSKDMKNGNLVINVIHGKEMEIEYKKKEIIEKINSFFGYNCINNISLKIAKETIKSKNIIFPKIKNLTEIKDKMKKINNNQLRNSLNKLVKAFNEKSE